MPRYRITTEYSSPAPLSPEDSQLVGRCVEAAAVAALRLVTGEGRVPPSIDDAMTLLRAWYRADEIGLPLVIAAGMPRDVMIANIGD